MIFIYFSTCGYSIGILEMIVLCFSMDGEDVLSIPMASIMCIYFSMQEEGVLEHTMVLSGINTIHFSQLVDHCTT